MCRIVPVVLYHKDNPGKEIKTSVLLDDATDKTFMTNKVKNELGVEGVDASLNLSTNTAGRQSLYRDWTD